MSHVGPLLVKQLCCLQEHWFAAEVLRAAICPTSYWETGFVSVLILAYGTFMLDQCSAIPLESLNTLFVGRVSCVVNSDRDDNDHDQEENDDDECDDDDVVGGGFALACKDLGWGMGFDNLLSACTFFLFF